MVDNTNIKEKKKKEVKISFENITKHCKTIGDSLFYTQNRKFEGLYSTFSKNVILTGGVFSPLLRQQYSFKGLGGRR